MKTLTIYKTLLSFFISTNFSAFILLMFVVLMESFISILTVVSIAPFADYLSNPSLSQVNSITEHVLVVLFELGITPSLLVFGLIFIFFNLVRGLMDVLLKYSTLRIKYILIEQINTNLIHNLLYTQWSFFKTLSQGKVLNTLTRETGTVGDMMGIMCTLFASIIKFGMLIAFPIMLFPSFMIMLILLMFLMIIPFLLLQSVSYKLGKQTTLTSNKSIEKLTEIIRSIKPIKSFLKENFVTEIYRKYLKSHYIVAIKSHTLGHSIYTSYQTFGIAAIVLTTIFHDTLLISEMAVIIWSMTQSLPMIGRVLSSNNTILNFFPSFEQLEEINSDSKNFREKSDGLDISNIMEIQLENVSYNVPKKSILKDININFKKGSISALCGKSGSGKTTLAEIIMNFSQPSKGEIFFNNQNSNIICSRGLRKRISYCSQETLLFTGTIFDNLSFVKPDLTINEAIKALKFADAYELVLSLDKGMMSEIGEYGALMSGGEKQKISLARAFLMQSDIYIFDEITASIDKLSEEIIYKNIKQLSKNSIVIFITHNVNALKFADKIHFIENGKLLASGDFNYLSCNLDQFKQFLSNMND